MSGSRGCNVAWNQCQSSLSPSWWQLDGLFKLPHATGCRFFWARSLGGTTRWLQLQPSSAWPRRRKRSKMFSLCTTRITARSSGDSSGFWPLISRNVLVLRRRYLIPIRCNNGKRKLWPSRWLHHFDFSTDDGCTRWRRWLHYFGRVIFDTHKHTHIRSPAD